MDRLKKLELIQRSLGIRHKLKVHESMKSPETHEDLAIMMLAKWELEDELHAIEEILALDRLENTRRKRRDYEKSHDLAVPPEVRGAATPKRKALPQKA
ncbi:MAG: hypothetical protein NDJ90_14650 [Oligoflexia bacterium]|nr:hypothetical protein [Oligoflexia bacterium]